MQLRNRLSLCTILVGLAVVWSTTVRADELRFPNGDRISGTLVSRDNGRIVFDSPALGRLDIPAERVASVMIDQPGSGGLKLPDEKPTLVAASATPPPVPANAPDKPVKSAKLTPPGWNGKLELGFRQYNGKRDDINFDFRASAERKVGRNDLKAAGRLLYGKQDERVNNERYDASFRWRRELGNRTFAQSLTSFYSDPIKAIDNNWEQNVGAGYRLLKTDDQTANVGAGLTAQYRASPTESGDVYTLVELFQDYSYQFNEWIKITQNAIAQYSPEGRARFISVGNQPAVVSTGESNYKLRFDTTLQGKITNSISLNVRYEYEFDNAVVTESARADQRITSSIGYGF